MDAKEQELREALVKAQYLRSGVDKAARELRLYVASRMVRDCPRNKVRWVYDAVMLER